MANAYKFDSIFYSGVSKIESSAVWENNDGTLGRSTPVEKQCSNETKV